MPTLTVTNFYTDNGRIIGEKVGNNPRTDYLTDALGSVTGTVNQSAQLQKTIRYKPYGAQLSLSGRFGTVPVFQWNGSWGYRPTALQHSYYYVRARHYATAEGRWTTVDPLWSTQAAYGYAGSAPTVDTDPTGHSVLALLPCMVCASCAIDLSLVCSDCGSRMQCWIDCIRDVIDNLPGWAKWLCGQSCEACLELITKEPLPPLPRPDPDPLPPPIPHPRNPRYPPPRRRPIRPVSPGPGHPRTPGPGLPTRPKRVCCEARCAQTKVDPNACCEGYLTAQACGATEKEACKMAMDAAVASATRGCQAKHCHCPRCWER